MVIKFKNGSVRETSFDSELAARLIKLGHHVEIAPGRTPEQVTRYTKATQKFWDYLNDLEVRRGHSVP